MIFQLWIWKVAFKMRVLFLTKSKSYTLQSLLSDLENEKDYQKMSRVSSKVTRMMLVLLIPCMIVLISSSKELTTLLFGRGKFDAKAIEKYVKWDRKELLFRHYLGMLLPTLISLFAVFCIPLKLDLTLQIATKSVFIGCIFCYFTVSF